MKLLLLFLVLLRSVTVGSQPLAYIDNVAAKERVQFEQAMIVTSDHLHIDPNWLMACIALETGKTFKPSIQNRYSYATGLIQFIPSTAKALGTTTAKLKSMTAVRQLAYVEKYFIPYAGKMQDITDVYLVIFAPAFLGQKNNTTLYSSFSPTVLGRNRYRWNRPLDVNQDGRITIRDITKYLKPFIIYESRRGNE